MKNAGKDWKADGIMQCGKPGGGSAVYGLGFLGALVYFLSHATDVWSGILGLVKAILWPAFLVHGLLRFLGL